jgi:hypothetical protein
VERFVNMREVVRGHVADEGLLDFVVAQATM